MSPDQIQQFFRNDRFAEHVGIELLDVGPGRARARLEIEDRHLNAVGVAHGAAIFSLADLVFAVASNSHGSVALGVNVSVSFLKSAGRGPLVAKAEEVSINPKLATYLIRVTDASEHLIALFQGTVYRKKDPLADHLPSGAEG
ncbi:PaaI family thioesterase [Thiorhodococcus mannitoliphagus]|uniref:PaaI family thioesterase n=1 Tax=Thiorhodococcus mannitoliphagus TaxID=329406 RepID=A0A6P1E0W5_9GAMM|nr:PaaI family thioesterase [Thiorhodococcus mannitoliphagus]NEX21385.1 PaaI family thioesterase [Thiorhodococcus mannitoliphagus]